MERTASRSPAARPGAGPSLPLLDGAVPPEVVSMRALSYRLTALRRGDTKPLVLECWRSMPSKRRGIRFRIMMDDEVPGLAGAEGFDMIGSVDTPECGGLHCTAPA